ncbi:hypothetical protein VTH06DRAFT_7652 [Thermothelomyces fergusii]
MTSYPCPYRKRNPARFNIREHEACARAPFDSIRALKQHIIHYHRRNTAFHQCRRCKERFQTEDELEEHVLLPKDRMCEVKELCLDDYEDGITEKTASILAASDADDAGPWDWQAIWRLLFPNDPEIPDAEFHPVAELAEAEQTFDEGQGSLKDELREKLQLLLPGPVDPSYLGFLTGQLELVFETHRINVIKRTLDRCRSNVGRSEFSQARPAEQPSAPKKPSRRSRRSTLLQAFQGGTHAPSRRESSAGGAARNDEGHQLCEQSASPPRSAESPFSAARTPSPHAGRPSSSLSAAGACDSRDSGIGLPCEASSLGPCQRSAAAHDGNRYHRRQQVQRAQCQHKHGGGKDHRRVSAFQSRLTVQTQELHLTYAGSAAGGGGGGDDDGGGGFSPESFKQRLLRQQLMGA